MTSFPTLTLLGTKYLVIRVIPRDLLNVCILSASAFPLYRLSLFYLYVILISNQPFNMTSFFRD